MTSQQYMQLESTGGDGTPWYQRHVRALRCGILCAGVVVILCATVSEPPLLHAQTAGEEPWLGVENLFNIMQGSSSRVIPQPAFRSGFRQGGQYSQPGGQQRPQQIASVWQSPQYGHQAATQPWASSGQPWRFFSPPSAEAEGSPGEAQEDFKGAEAWSSQFAEPEAVLDILKVKDILPHRYPFLLVDKIIEFVPGKKAVGIKKVTTNEEFFNGHFPERPIMPGVLQVEAMAQVGGIVALQPPITDGKGDFFFAGVDKVKWRRPVVPGDTLVMEMELISSNPRFGIVKMKGTSYVDGKKVVEGDFQFAMVKKKE